ncbi:MAG: hypothetical protein NTV15_08700 [Candidatus Bathyarchaeota archaeon]|nr:hypothetical protein [Candidatus Bathyarchaeota archaeon]
MENKAATLHTLKWYIENHGIDPLRLGIPYKEVPNPYYRSEPRLKLWDEAEVFLHKMNKANKNFKNQNIAEKREAIARKDNLKSSQK